MVLAALYYLFLAIWGSASPPDVVENIASMLPFWILYGLMLVNTGVCLWRRFPALRLDLARTPRWGGRDPEWSAEMKDRVQPESARKLLIGLGFRPSWEQPGVVGGYRRRWTALGTFLFHGAFFLLAIGFLLSLTMRQEARVWTAVGEEFQSLPDQFLSQSSPAPLAVGVPAIEYRVARILPEFWRDQLLFTTLEADLVLPGGKQATTRINRPLWLGFGAFVRLSGFGYAPRYELLDRDGRVVDSAFIKLNVFPPGQRDYFRLPEYPHRFYLQVYPDLEVENDIPATRTLNLVEPGVALHVFRGRLDLGGSLHWGEFSVVRDAGAPILFLGYLVGIAGLLIKLGGRRQEIEWRAGPGGGPGRIVGWGGPPPDVSRIARPVDRRGVD
jgi:hypothetical protein